MVYRGNATNGDETLGSTERTESRLGFETLISELSSRFVNLRDGEVHDELEDALRRVCEFLGIDLAVLWQWSVTAQDSAVPTHAYPALAALRLPEATLQGQYSWTVEQMRAGRVVAFRALEELPAEAAVDLEYAQRRGVKSSLCLPLAVGGGSAIGAVAFNTVRVHRDWPATLVNRLQLVAQVFAQALARQRADDALRESQDRMDLAVDSAEAGLWTLDYGTGVFWATARARALFGFSPDEVITMERLRAAVHPEDWDLVRGAVERSAREGELVDIDYRVILPAGGRVRWISSRARPHLKPTGEPDRLTGVSIDVSERRRAQEALQASEARLMAGAELAGLAFCEVDFLDGRPVSRSPRRLVGDRE